MKLSAPRLPRLSLRFILLFSTIITPIALVILITFTEFNSQMAILITALATSVVSIILFTNRIISPIEKLLSASKQFGQGHLDYRINVRTNDEIEDLANEFNNMASNLENNITQLTRQNKLLGALRRLDMAILSNFEIETLCQTIVDVMHQEFGYITGTIYLVDYQMGYIRRVAISRYPGVDQILKQVAPVPFEEQKISLDEVDNLLVKTVNERRSFYTTKLFDLQKGLFSEEVAGRIQQAFGFKGVILYPLMSKNSVVGILGFPTTLEQEKLSKFELAVMEEFSSEVARAIENANLYQDLKKQQEASSAERNKLAVTLSGITDAVIAVDLAHNIILFNIAAENLTGYKEKEVLGKPLNQVLKFYEDQKEVVPLNYCPIRTDGFEGIVCNKPLLKLIGNNNKESYVNLISGQIKEGPIANLGCILTLHDVTKEKQLEEMKLDFVSMAAHELRTPLTSVKGYLSLLQKEMPTKGEHREFLEKAMVATMQLSDLVENLLNVSRIERGVFNTGVKSIDWLKIVQETVSEFRPRAIQKGISLDIVATTEGLPQIQADGVRVKEILSNLLSNAIKYTEKGGIKVWFELQGSEIVTHVQDTGKGIPESAIPRLFSKFFRVSEVLEQGAKGTGLGLYIAKSIVDMYHGKIWVESKLNQGSTFSFSLPLSQPASSVKPVSIKEALGSFL